MSKTVIVTGAAGALGSVVARALQDRGFDVYGIDLAEASGDGLAGFYGGVDLGEAAAVGAAVEAIAAKAGRIDGLVNIVGGFVWETVEDGSIESWDRMYRMNVRPTVLMSKAALPHLRASDGAIVNIGANAARQAGMGMGAYGASKAGVAKLTEALAEEEKTSRVRVNAILPSIIDTPANRKDMPDADPSTWVEPAAAAELIGFLLGDGARAITGACIPIVNRC